jgi:hypothetical protein
LSVETVEILRFAQNDIADDGSIFEEESKWFQIRKRPGVDESIQ